MWNNNKFNFNKNYHAGSGNIFVNPESDIPTDPANIPNFKAPVMIQGVIDCSPKIARASKIHKTDKNSKKTSKK